LSGRLGAVAAPSNAQEQAVKEARMRAIFIKDYGSAENLVAGEAFAPAAAAGEVLVKVAFAGLRWGDIMQRNGFPSRARLTPFIGGQEAAGVVEAVGDGVADLKPGDRVVALVGNGSFAEYVAAPAATCIKLPDHVPLDRSLAYPVNMRTAHLMVYAWAKVKEGETVLLHAAAGGVGLLALQILKRRFKTVRVIGITSTADKEKLLKAEGCDHVINRKTQDYVEEINRICGPKATGFMTGGQQGGGVDVSFNGVSGATLVTDPQVIRKRGRWVIYGYAGGRGVIDTSPFGYDGITIMPFSSIAWRGTPEDDAARAFTEAWMKSETLVQPVVYPLEKAAEVERDMEEGRTVGKVVLKI
jgi:NADPH:quinone reductase